MTIIKLDLKTSTQIAAGEVVESPSSVVKELLENAIDAGASRIRVLLQKGGLQLISVLDDGCGIPAAEVRLALERHATSKISNMDDLTRVTTLGFRGEALPSIAAVSCLEIITRHEQEETGSHISLEAGGEKAFKAAGFPRGTQVTVKDLFFNLPVRRGFLRSVAAETARATRLVELIALSHPHISFTLERDGKTVLETSGDGDLLNTILKIFGLRLAPYLLPVNYKEGSYRLEGYVSSPSLSLKSRSHQVFYANRRHVQNRLFREALEKSFSRFVTARRYPLAFLFLSLPAQELDVNVHPAKTEVRFRREKDIFHFMLKGLSSAYGKSGYLVASEPSSRHTTRHTQEDLSLNYFNTIREKRDETPEVVQESLNRFQSDRSEKAVYTEINDPTLPGKEAEFTHGADTKGADNDTHEPLFSGEINILGQLFATYLLVQQGNSMLLIDQHAAHERVLWEQCLQRRADDQKYRQALLPFPQELILPLAENFLSAKRIKLLAEAGLELEQFGNNSFIIRTVPFFLKDIITAEMLEDLLAQIARLSAPGDREWQEKALLQLTCKAAVKANKYLTNAEMEALLHQLEKCRNPWYCPHGRPIVRRITKQEVEKMFLRS